MTLPEAIADGLQLLIDGYPVSPDDGPDPMLAVAVAFLRGLKEELPAALRGPLPAGVRSAIGESIEKPAPLVVVNRDAMLGVVDVYRSEVKPADSWRCAVVDELRQRLENLPTINVDVASEAS